MVRGDVLGAEFLLRVFFRVAAGSVFKGSENCCWHIGVVHQLGASIVETLSKQHASLDGSRSELKLTMLHITDSIDVRNVSLLEIIHNELAV